MDHLAAPSSQRALVQGLAWNQGPLSNKVAPLAKREKLCRRYFARIVRLPSRRRDTKGTSTFPIRETRVIVGSIRRIRSPSWALKTEVFRRIVLNLRGILISFD